MISELQLLIEALREELQEYGEILALLDQQQDLVVHRAAAELVDTVARIQDQAQAIQAARAHRQRCQARLAGLAGLAEDATLFQLNARLPEDYRPLVNALVQENNELLLRVHQRSRQNHLLLTRSVDLMQRLISTLLPAADGPTYCESGAVLERSMPLRALYDAVG